MPETDTAVLDAPETNEGASIPEKAKTFLVPYEERREKLLDRVARAMTMTSTTWWRENHADAVRSHKVRVETETKALAEAVLAIQNDGSKEDTEKAVKDAAKSLATEREEWSVYIGRVVSPIATAVRQYQDFRTEVLSKVNEFEHQGSLHLPKALADHIRAQIDLWEVAEFDQEKGIVTFGAAPAAASPEASAAPETPTDDEAPKGKSKRRKTAN